MNESPTTSLATRSKPPETMIRLQLSSFRPLLSVTKCKSSRFLLVIFASKFLLLEPQKLPKSTHVFCPLFLKALTTSNRGQKMKQSSKCYTTMRIWTFLIFMWIQGRMWRICLLGKCFEVGTIKGLWVLILKNSRCLRPN